MDLLRTAVVDITTLVATCHACHACHANTGDGEQRLRPKWRDRLRQELKRATVAYIDALARSRRGVVDAALLNKCRLAAEQHMAHALAKQALLGRIMASEAGSLDGLAAARQDLWRLAHAAVFLGSGVAALRAAVNRADAKAADVLATHLRRRLRKALTAYARAALRSKATQGRLVINARDAALAQIGSRGNAEAEGLAKLEAGVEPPLSVIRLGVAKPLMDLTLDWRERMTPPQ
jgi:hypothetical protein